MTQQVKNNAQSTLGATITSGATSLTVASATPFPTSGDFSILIDSEIMLVTAVAGTTFTVTRAQEGTAAAGHTAAAVVTAPLTATALTNIIRRDHVGTAIPTGGTSGDIKVGTGVIWVNDAGTWKSAALGATGGGTPLVYPQSSTLTYRARPTIPTLPTYLTPVTDPTWGTKITRVTNATGDRHAYSRIPAWNSDGSKILMNFGGAVSNHMIDGSTYSNLYTISLANTTIWSNQDPNKLFGCQGANFVSIDATTGTQTTLKTFVAADIGGFAINDMLIGAYEGAISDDDRIVSLTFNYNAGANVRILTYDIVNNAIIGQIAAPAGFDNSQCSRLGNYIIVVATGGTRKYVPSLASYTLISTSTNHGDNALNAGGEEIYVMNNAPLVKSVRLVDNVTINLLGTTATAYEYGHVSGRAFNRPGWVYLSVYDTITTAGRLGLDQVIALKTDGSGTVQVFGFANHNRDGVTAGPLPSAYAAQPHAVPNRTGDKVLVASEWGATNVYDYVYSA